MRVVCGRQYNCRSRGSGACLQPLLYVAFAAGRGIAEEKRRVSSRVSAVNSRGQKNTMMRLAQSSAFRLLAQPTQKQTPPAEVNAPAPHGSDVLITWQLIKGGVSSRCCHSAHRDRKKLRATDQSSKFLASSGGGCSRLGILFTMHASYACDACNRGQAEAQSCHKIDAQPQQTANRFYSSTACVELF
jgi:hypothetical protein